MGACPRARSDVAPGSSYDTGSGSCIAIHAEANALLYADRDKCEGATIYCTDEPCDGCLRLIVGAGVTRVMTPSDKGLIFDGTWVPTP
jgi:dCMP deaminase